MSLARESAQDFRKNSVIIFRRYWNENRYQIGVSLSSVFPFVLVGSISTMISGLDISVFFGKLKYQ